MTSKKKQKKNGSGMEGSKDAKRLASAILEVLSGLRSPPEASQALQISLQRYYTLEKRALQGLVKALEPRARGGGRRPDPKNQITQLQRERDQLQRELRRAHALVRVAQRTVGLPCPQAQREAQNKKRKKAGKKATRKPRVRARKTIASLRAELVEPEEPIPNQAEQATPETEKRTPEAKKRTSA